MDSHSLTLRLLPGTYSVAQPAAWPDWLPAEGIVSVTRTAEEVSVVCESRHVPADVRSEPDWILLELAGPIPFAMTGVLASILNPLAQANIGIFALSTYNTDYLLLKCAHLAHATAALTAAGHRCV